MAKAHPVVGFIGLGRMGLPMCPNLLKAGSPLVACNRTSAKADGLRAAGARALGSAGDVAKEADVICVCLDRVETSRQVFLAREIGAGLDARGIGFLDAPVSGGPEGAEQGTLTIMAGGSAETFERAGPAPVTSKPGRRFGSMPDLGLIDAAARGWSDRDSAALIGLFRPS